MRLEKAVAEVLDKFSTEFIPVRKNITIPKQYDLWGNPPNGSHVTMGYFYELITNCLFGGTVMNHIYIPKYKSESHVGSSKPDVVTSIRVLESKACVTGNQVILHDDQVYRYKRIQIKNREKQIHYIVFRHTFRNVKKFKGSQIEMYNDLAVKTVCCIVIPLKIIDTLHACADHTMVRRYEEKPTYGACTVVRSPILNMLFMDPNSIIEGLLLKPRGFKLERFISPRLSIDSSKVNPFPIMLITDRSSKGYADSLSKTFGDDIPF